MRNINHNLTLNLNYILAMKVIVTRTKKRIISMRIDERGVLQVLANNKLSLERIKAYVESKRDWVTRQLQAERSNAAECVTTAIVEQPSASAMSQRGIAEMFSGKRCLVGGDNFCVRPTVESKCYLDGNAIYIPEKYYAQKDTRLKALKNYIKKLSVQTVADKISRFGSCASLCPTRIEFRTVNDGWVKCTRPSERIISLDYRICQIPDILQHYVIVHAFSHFVNEGHDEMFWNTVSNYLPRYKSCAEELKHYDFLKDI